MLMNRVNVIQSRHRSINASLKHVGPRFYKFVQKTTILLHIKVKFIFSNTIN